MECLVELHMLLVALLHGLQQLQQLTKVICTCFSPFDTYFSDGVGRTGTFICIHSQLERLKTEGVVDIFQSIKSARVHRAGLVQSVVWVY